MHRSLSYRVRHACPQQLMLSSGFVDQAWHELLLDTEEYMQHCQRLGSAFLHHNPEGPRELDRIARYARTLQHYRRKFGHDATDSWVWDDLESVTRMTQREVASAS